MKLAKDYFKKRFDTSLLEPQISDEDLTAFLEACIPYADYFAGIAVNTNQLPLTVDVLTGTGIDVAGVSAYPIGGIPTVAKQAEVAKAIELGAQQVDVVMRIESLLIGDFASVRKDAEAVVEVGRGAVNTMSLIADAGYLDEATKLEAARIVKDLGATYKTNTGFGLVTTLDDVMLIREQLGDLPKIMVSGGCRTTEQAINFFRAGANKIATSTPAAIFEGFERLLKLQGELEVSR